MHSLSRGFEDLNGESPGTLADDSFLCTVHHTLNYSPHRDGIKSCIKISLVDLFANEEPLKCLCISMAKLLIKGPTCCISEFICCECLFKNY